jgi:MFS family permease
MFAKNRRLLYAIALFQGMVFYGSVATLYRQLSGLTVFQITLIESISLAVMLLLEIPWGYAADRVGYKNTIVLCSFLFCLSKLVFWKADSFFAFLLERLILSVVLSGLSGCDSAFLYSNMGDKNPKKVFAAYSVMGTAGLLFAAVTFSLFLSSNLRQTAFLTFITYAAAFVLSLFLSGKAEGTEKRAREAIAPGELFLAVVSDKRYLCYLVACAFLMETGQTVTVFLSQLQYQRSGIPVQLYGYLYLLLTGAGMFAMGAATLGKRLKEKGLMLMAGFSCLMLYASSLALLSVAGIIVIRIATSLLYPLLEDSKNRHVQHANRATVLSGYSMLMSLTGVFTNLVFGWLSDMGVGYAMLFGMALSFAGFFMVSRAHRGTSEGGQ